MNGRRNAVKGNGINVCLRLHGAELEEIEFWSDERGWVGSRQERGQRLAYYGCLLCTWWSIDKGES